MRISKVLLALSFAVLCFSSSANAAEKSKAMPPMLKGKEVKIAAVVNDNVITVSDVESRMKLYLLGAKGQPTPEDIMKLTKQTLDEMIDETIQITEAAKYNINVADADTDAGLAEIAKRNNATPEKMAADLKKSGVDIKTLRQKIKAEMAWAQLVRGKFASKVSVSDDEINMTIDKLNDNDQTNYLLAQIDLLVPSKEDEPKVLAKAEELVKIIKSGAHFSMVAIRNSQTPGASTGGDLGWLKESQLEPAVLAAVRNLKPGELTAPVRTQKGWSIVLLREIKNPEVQAKEDVKKEDDGSRTQIANQLGTKRLTQLALHYLKDLRAAAFIEKRI